jgi:predicted transcriptional regulator
MLKKLIELGLSKTEAEIYLALLEHNKLTPARISRITGINRSTVYAAALELVKKGVITEDLSGKTKYLLASEPENLLTEVEKNMLELKKKEKLIKEIIPNLELLPKSKNYSIPKIQFIEGEEILDFLYKKTSVWEQSMNDCRETTWWGFQDDTFVENIKFREWITWYWNRAPENIDLKLFTNQSDVENKISEQKIEKRQIKFWHGSKFTSTQWVVGEYIISIVTQGKLNYLVQIRDAVFAESMRNFIKNSWENSN